MARASITIIGLPQMAERIRRLTEEMEDVLPAALMAGGFVLSNAWKRNIVAQGLVDTGTYLRSVHPEVTEKREGFAEVTVGTDITDPPYPWWLETGTSRMEPRPHARPAFDASQAEIQQEVVDALKDVLVHYGRV